MRHIKFFRYLIPFWKKEILILFLSGISMALGLVNPYLTKLIIDKAYKDKDLKLFIVLVISVGVIFILSGIFKGVADYLNRCIKLRIDFALKSNVFKKSQHLPYRFFQDTSTGDQLYKFSYDIEQASQFITDLLPQAISLILKSIFILAIILWMNPKICLFALALTPFLYIGPYYFTMRLKKALKIWVEDSQGIFKRLQEVFSHNQLIKAFGKETSESRIYIRKLIHNIRLNLVNMRLDVIGSFINSLANRIILGLIIFYGGYQVIKGGMTLGVLSAITIYLSQLSGLQGSLAFFFQKISRGIVSCDRLETILSVQPECIEDRQSREIIFSKADLQFKDVSFYYSQDKMILKNFSFDIKTGSFVALAGPSGCGKTTIANLILRLYKPVSGEILVDGVNIGMIKSNALYSQVSAVLQESYLWNDTVENNIRYGKAQADFSEIIEAARVSGIDGFIQGLGLGYNTVIGENACKISEGQKQRIAIARAVIRKPKILILDEAFSSLDAEIEAVIIKNIKTALKDSTVIVISHRLSTIKQMDQVYFLNHSGKICTGKHEELLSNNPDYQAYLSGQLK